ncbi:holo-ACP synthase [Staphylococcus epidermidis]|uniref:holo-ACP synthase n=1 Tax=Staphylococcus epidermidis TaxID=1282 RepID=UPI00026BF56C|nr:holo-ACP synthase [Staphylococcus epidermidis]EJD91490.1 holo-[acyl-carrier-protein] synthase [Staphylococcus epidermidis NIHLM057]EJD91902.1 holo-[acyl-carrier-protein] synthase [Staphylococcus epidermidis NIHLM053]EJE12099.1 holo-[acyl-carrier-protein] synthase [Staphylococcus epidermidis NIHLM031]MBM0791709.1 holo-ACP synthase [Staphylococcus epidermidis]MCG1060379.1 holo-ACP synthase [Staphylococcus epidermidis]
MIYGIGIDLIEIERIKNLQNQTKFIERILTIEERDKLNQYTHEQRRLEFLAGRFTVKEAFSKALGTGLGKSVSFQDINCYNDTLGKPCIDYPGFDTHVSITHTENYAMSQVILEKNE